MGRIHRLRLKSRMSRSEVSIDSKYGAGGSLTRCSVCKKDSKDTKRCTVCYMVWCCGQECQNTGWEDHKAECKKTRKEYKVVKVSKTLAEAMGKEEEEHETRINLLNSTNTKVPGKPTKKSHFVVKVQVPAMKDGLPMCIYNQDRSTDGFMSYNGNEDIYVELSKQIRSKGFQGLKGYFRVILDKDRLKLNPYKLQTVETW